MSDFDQIWAGARALWQGKDPYRVVGLRGEFLWKWPLYYPLPALLIAAPLSVLPILVARALFAGMSAFALAWGATREGWFRLPIFLSVSFLVSVELVQWSPLFAAAFFVPSLTVLGTAKPNLAVALGVSARTSRTLILLLAGGLALVVASEVLRPGWHEAWLENLRLAPHFHSAVMRPLGFLLLLAAFKWRRPEARWLLGLSLVPLPPSFYEPLLLGVVCNSARESLIFAASTVALFFYVGFNTPLPDYASWGTLVGNATVWLCYLPCLAMVLRRPNEGELPAFIFRAQPASSP